MSDPSRDLPSQQAQKLPTDLSSILQQVQQLQGDKEKLLRELESARENMSKLQEGKREEMKKIFETVIQKWLADSVANEEVRKEFQEGCSRMADKANECGIWTVACQASALHAKQLDELERLRQECTALREGGGQFKDEASRKRAREDAPPAKDDFWGGLKIDYNA